MKRIYIIPCLFVFSCVAFGQQITDKSSHKFDVATSSSRKIVEYIASQFTFPDVKKDTITGIFAVLIKFAVDVDGSVVDAEIMFSTHPELNAEVLKIVKSMPKWKPAYNRRGRLEKTPMIIQGVFSFRNKSESGIKEKKQPAQ